MSARNGTMLRSSVDGHGLWLGDTRFLSEYYLLIHGKRSEADRLDSHTGGVTWHLHAGPFQIKRERYLASGMHERLTITNASEGPETADLEFVFDADFAAMLAVRGIVQLPPCPAAKVVMSDRGFLLQDGDGSRRQTEVVISPPGRKQSVRLEPGASATLEVHVLPRAGLEVPQFDVGEAKIRDIYDSWAQECAHFETDNPELNELIDQSRDDMRMLTERYPTGIYPTAGLPWFAVPFGRDGLFTSMFALPVNPRIASGALKFLALHQGNVDNPETEEQPGKILHEVRTGEVVESGIWPHILYGTVDATPLYVVALVETHDWTGDDKLLDDLLPAAERALRWCEEWGDTDNDGWIDYRGARFRNEGWKDSDNSLSHTDGTLAPNPAALCEVQAYYYRALLGMARRRPELKARAEDMQRRFNQEFWMAREGFVAQALDGNHRQVQAISSNPGHCLWTSILPPERAQSVSTRLMEADMWSGWGIRTLSDLAVNYDPCSYHNGSVWPHDGAIAAAGMRLAGCAREAEHVARMLLEAGMAFPDRRLPELWCGTSREPGELPDDYRNSCSPQNWAAASVFSLLTTLLGLNPDSNERRLRIDPISTPLFTRLEVHGLHFAGERIDFAVENGAVKLGRVPRGIKIETPA